MKIGDMKDGLNSGRYLKNGMILELKPDKKAVPASGKMPSPEEIKILDTAVSVLRSQKIEDFDPLK